MINIRKFIENEKFSVHAIAGTHVVLLGFDVDEQATNGLLGFAIERIDHMENERYWLKGFKTFEEIEPFPQPGSLKCTLEHPVQTFLWADYTAKPNYDYSYNVYPMYGKPKNLKKGQGLTVRIQTDKINIGIHGIFFNRGVIGSQAYSRKFGNRNPNEIPNKQAFQWLSRGLEEAILDFIGKADNNDYGLRAAVYEFSQDSVLKAFDDARKRGVDVKIIYDSKKRGPFKKTLEAIQNTGANLNLIPRKTGSYIAHNKFIILLKNNEPLEVWTGSTNFTKSGIFGHSNVGHTIRDQNIAEKYWDYWKELATDPTAKKLREWNNLETPIPNDLCSPNSIIPIFSPRKTYKALDWYVKLMDNAKESLFLTAAFGVNAKLAKILAQDKPYLRYLLLERPGDNIQMISSDKDVQIAIGSKFIGETLNEWLLKENPNMISKYVKYVHTKYLLIDPLSEDPIVITGSANFSFASTKKNDENMLVIRGNTHVADIYLGEFMRLFNHFYVRYIMKKQRENLEINKKHFVYLVPNDSWCKDYYTDDTVRKKKRELFSGKKRILPHN